jgi:hypothetical protein
VARQALQAAIDALARLYVPEEQTVISALRLGMAPTTGGILRREAVVGALACMASRIPRACCRMRLVEQLPDEVIAERLGIAPEEVTRYVYYGLDFAARRLAAGPVARVRRQTWPLVLQFGLDPVEVDRVSHWSAGRRDWHDDSPLDGVPEDTQTQPA